MINRKKIVTVSSFHSTVPFVIKNIIKEEGISPEAIVCFDSHVDGQLGAGAEGYMFVDDLATVAHRTCAHTYIRYMIPSIDMYLVIPHCGFVTDCAVKYNRMGVGFSSVGELEDFIKDSYKSSGYEMFDCPPKKLRTLQKRIQRKKNVIVDIDIDYLSTCQDECYTPIKKAKKKELGSIDQVIGFIRRIHPQLITVSEAKTEYIEDEESNFEYFLSKLEDLGYEVKYCNIVEGDRAEELLTIYDDYEKSVQRPIFDRFRREYGDGFIDDKKKIKILEERTVQGTKEYFECIGRMDLLVDSENLKRTRSQ